MWKSVCVVFLACFVAYAFTQRKASRKRITGTVGSCANVFCGIGRECVEGLSEEPVCDCIERCFEPPNPVCASNNVTYDNECEMNRAACNEEMVLKVVSKGSCNNVKEMEMKLMKEEERKSPRPVVCLENDRDSLRKSLLKWIKKIEAGIETDGKKHNEILKDIFLILDENQDKKLETMEFVKLLEGNESISEILTTDKHTNPVLRGLCADALIAITDVDSDYKLSLEEFMKCLDPDYKFKPKKCSLGDKTYADGEEVPQRCNNCVCACGSWVCTAINCENSVHKKFKTVDDKSKKMNKKKE